MITAAITTPDCYCDANGFLYLRRTKNAIQVAYTAGCIEITCSAPCFLMRDLSLDGSADIATGTRDRDSLFENVITSVEFKSRVSPASSLDDIFADNHPVAPNCFLLESRTWAAYHPIASIQAIGIRGTRIYLITSSQTYHIDVFDDSARPIFNKICDRASKYTGFQVTQLPPEGYWVDSTERFRASEITEARNPPDSLGGFDQILDLRGQEANALFAKKVPAPKQVRGHIEL